MKTKLFLLTALALPAAASAQIQLIAGWDFGQFTFEGTSATHPDGEPNASLIPANFSSIGLNNPVSTHVGNSPVNAGTGTISWTLADADNGLLFSTTGTRTINTTMVDFAGSFMSNTNSDPSSLGLGFTAFSGKSFSISVNASGFGDYVDTAANFSFAAASEGAVTIQWFLNSNLIGSNTLTAGNLTTFSLYTLDLPALFYGTNSTLVGVVSGSSTFTLDNLQVNGEVSAIPEPSSFAAIAGLVGLGFAASRRRRAA